MRRVTGAIVMLAPIAATAAVAAVAIRRARNIEEVNLSFGTLDRSDGTDTSDTNADTSDASTDTASGSDTDSHTLGRDNFERHEDTATAGFSSTAG